jgi:hypothetical protein
MAMGVSGSNVLNKKARTPDWADLRKSLSRIFGADLKDTIGSVVKDRANYGYRRAWARLKVDGRQIDHKRVYRIMGNEGWQLVRKGQSPMNTRKHECT